MGKEKDQKNGKKSKTKRQASFVLICLPPVMVWASTYQECCNTVGIFAIVVVALVDQPAFERRTVSRRCCSSLRQPLQSLDSCVAGRTRFVKNAFLVDRCGTHRTKRKNEKHNNNSEDANCNLHTSAYQYYWRH